VREARARARLSQRELARRAGSVQSVVARIEQGRVSPTWETLVRLLGAAGFELESGVRIAAPSQPSGLDDVARILALTPEQRLDELRNLSRLVAGARRG
jgi:transcriptional regulator with XRE-family HTH domain